MPVLFVQEGFSIIAAGTVYALFTAVFFPRSGGTVLFSIYLTGILLAVLTGLLFKKTILKGETSTFVMELPPYHLPTFRGIMYHTMSRLKGFVTRAGKVILVVVVVLSFLGSLGTDWSFGNQDSSDSVLSAVGRAITPVFRPMGITGENWPAAVGLFSGIFAKEAVVGTLDNLYTSMAEEPMEAAEESDEFSFAGGVAQAFRSIPEGFRGPEGDGPAEASESAFQVMRTMFDGPAGAYAYLLFILIYAPCVAAIAAIYRETSLAWAAFSTAYLTVLAWTVSTLFYRVATFHRSPGESLLWLSVASLVAGGVWLTLKGLSKAGKPGI